LPRELTLTEAKTLVPIETAVARENEVWTAGDSWTLRMGCGNKLIDFYTHVSRMFYCGAGLRSLGTAEKVLLSALHLLLGILTATIQMSLASESTYLL